MATPALSANAAPREMQVGNERFASLNGIYSIWRREVIRFLRDRSRLVGSLGQSLLFLVVFGSGLSSAIGRLGQGNGMPGMNYVQFMFPGILVMAVLFTALMSAISVVWDREFGFLKEVLVAPVPRWAVAVGKALGGSTTAVFQGVIILVFAPFIGAGLTALSILELLPAMFLTAFAMCAVGLVIAARMKTMEGFQVIMNFLLMPMFFLSGALFPLGNLPGWLTVLTRINPVSYGVDAIRRIILVNGGVSVWNIPVRNTAQCWTGPRVARRVRRDYDRAGDPRVRGPGLIRRSNQKARP
jgi:ABC-2 type transport system permease protein